MSWTCITYIHTYIHIHTYTHITHTVGRVALAMRVTMRVYTRVPDSVMVMLLLLGQEGGYEGRVCRERG